jgi:predicted DNA-binding WGR domain protein
MAPRLLTLSDAEGIARRGRAWTFRLEYHGQSSSGNDSHKFWYATGRELQEKVEIGWGRIGALPQNQLIDWPDLRDRVAEKLNRGYDYEETDFIRMSASAIATLGGIASPVKPSAVPVASPVKAAPGPVAAPKYTKTPSAALIAMGEPWSLIRAFKMQRTGSAIAGYKALDENGDELLTLDPKGGLDFARLHDIEVEF